MKPLRAPPPRLEYVCADGKHAPQLGVYQGLDLRWYRRVPGEQDVEITKCPLCRAELK